MKISLNIDYRELERSLNAAASRVGIGAGKIVEEDANEIMKESKMECPTDTGALLDSAFVDVDKGFMNGQAVFGYSGSTVNPKNGQPSSDYMVKVHEDLTASHTTGKAKFLEDPVNRYRAKFEKTLAGKIAKLIGD